jgi:hypothetical protein
MFRWSEVWALAGATLLLGLMAGVSDPEGPSDKAIRSQRVRVSRVARPDVDHDASDNAPDALQGKAVTSLVSQVAPWQHAPVASLSESAFWTDLPAASEPLAVFAPQSISFLAVRLKPGRAPPSL